MKTIMVFFICALFAIIKTDRLENEAKEIINIIERRRLSLFPKNGTKAVLKPHNTTNKNEKELVTKIAQESETRKPLMVNFDMKSKLSHSTKAVTRQPLMKVLKYTVKMRSLKKKSTDKILKQENVRKVSFKIDDIHDNKKLNSQNTKIVESKFRKGNGNTNVSGTNKNKPQLHKTIDYEEEDRREFIFLKKSTIKNGKDYLETTADSERKRRKKRFNNIIEEENMGTTVSPLKFTGHDSRLTNDMYFKNINH